MGLRPKSSMMSRHRLGQRREFAFVGAHCPRRGDVQGLGEVALSGAAGADDEHQDFLLQVAAGGRIHDLRLVYSEVEGEVVAFERLMRVDTDPALPHDEFALFAAGDLVLDEQGQEIHVGELLLHGLPVADLQGVQDAGETELFQMRRKLGDGIHEFVHIQLSSSGLREKRDVPP